MKCRIICHMISSIDGRLYPSRWSTPFIKTDIGTVYDEAASLYPFDGWIIGRPTMAELDDSIEERDTQLRISEEERSPFIGNHTGKRLGIVFDSKGKLHYKSNILPSGEHIVTVLSAQVSDEYLQELQKVGVSYVFMGKGADAVNVAIKNLEDAFKVKTLLLEGGGSINGSFLKANLIDEFSILIYPGVDGLAGVPSIINYVGKDKDELPSKDAQLHLLNCEKFAGDVVLLRYAVSYKNRE